MTKLILAFVLATVASVASAQTTEPKFGGCLTSHPDTCFAPTVSVNLMAMRLKNGDITPRFDPGIGYGVNFYSSKWYRAGAAATLAITTVDGSARAQPAITFTFAEYLRLGLACPLYAPGGFKDNAVLTFAIGADFGFGRL